MRLNKNEERNTKDYLSNRIDRLNIYFLSNDLSKCQELNSLNTQNIISIDNRNDLTFLKNKTSYELQAYDLIIVSSNNYNIAFSEQLRTLTNRLAIENNKSIMAAYHYDVVFKNEDEVKFFFETPNFESISTIDIDKMSFDISKLLDIAVYMFDEKNKRINGVNKVLIKK